MHAEWIQAESLCVHLPLVGELAQCAERNCDGEQTGCHGHSPGGSRL